MFPERPEHAPPAGLVIVPPLQFKHYFTDRRERVPSDDLQNSAFRIGDGSFGWAYERRRIGRHLKLGHAVWAINYSDSGDFIGFFF